MADDPNQVAGEEAQWPKRKRKWQGGGSEAAGSMPPFGADFRALMDADAALKEKQAAAAVAKEERELVARAEAASKVPGGEFAELHREAAMVALDELNGSSPAEKVAAVLRQCESAGVPEGEVSAKLAARGIDQARLSMMTSQLQAAAAKIQV